jgi:hypothetical protein
MVHESLTLAPVETPMERIFEKVMMRKMTEEEKEILELNVPAKPRKKSARNRASLSRKDGSRLRGKNVAKLTSI